MKKNLEDKTNQLVKRANKIPMAGPIELIAVKHLLDTAEDYLIDQSIQSAPEGKYNLAERALKDIEFSSGDLRQFLLQDILKDDRSTYLGYFISAMIDKVSDNTLVRYHVDSPVALSGLGMHMYRCIINVSKNLGSYAGAYMDFQSRLIVEGNVGEYAGFNIFDGELFVGGTAADYAGQGMKNGNIEIVGKVCSFLGQGMEGGLIEAFSNALYEVGHSMEGGKIIVRGDAADGVGSLASGGKIEIFGDTGKIGRCMKGGEIVVHGTIGEIVEEYNHIGFWPSTCKGTIYHKDKKVWPE